MPRPPAITPLPDGSGARILLPDGRSLGFCEGGAADGAPLFWFPGTPGSRLAAASLGSAAKHLGVRLIVVERPGFGVSTFQPNRGILSFPPDLAALAGALRLDRFA